MDMEIIIHPGRVFYICPFLHLSLAHSFLFTLSHFPFLPRDLSLPA